MRRKHLLSLFMMSMGVALLVAAMAAGGAVSATKAGPGGTLTIGTVGKVRWLDPAIAYDTRSWSAIHLTSLTLVGYDDNNGAGSPLKAEGAVGFPKITNNGKLVVWKVKSGLQFSDGTPVTAASYKRAFERILSPCMYGGGLGVADFFDKLIAGGKAFNTAACDMNAHMNNSSVSAVGQTLTIHLTQSAPYFTAAMAMMWFTAIPANTPYNSTQVGSAEAYYPGAGPYYVDSTFPAGGNGDILVTLKRNNFYSGPRLSNPDVIRYKKFASQSTCYSDVTSGSPSIDLDLCGLTGPVAAQAQSDIGASTTTGVDGATPGGGTRFHVESTGCVGYLVYDMQEPPTDNAKVRQALSWIINKDGILNVLGVFAGSWTQNILTPTIPGYKKITGFGHTPNWTKALSVAGGTNGVLKNKTLNIWYSGDIQSSIDQNGVLKGNIDAFSSNFGQNMTVNISNHPSTEYYDDLGNLAMATTGGDAFNIAPAGWCADYNDPFNYLNVLFSGKSIVPIGNVNFSYANVPALNARLEAAAKKAGPLRKKLYVGLDKDIVMTYAAALPYNIIGARSVAAPSVSNWKFNSFMTTPAFNMLSVN